MPLRQLPLWIIVDPVVERAWRAVALDDLTKIAVDRLGLAHAVDQLSRPVPCDACKKKCVGMLGVAYEGSLKFVAEAVNDALLGLRRHTVLREVFQLKNQREMPAEHNLRLPIAERRPNVCYASEAFLLESHDAAGAVW